MSQTIPIPPPMVYANKLEFAIPIATVTASNWYEAMTALQSTREARAAMRDVWEWEQTSDRYRRQEEEATTKARASSVVAPSLFTPPPQCIICNSPLSSRRQKRFCSRSCSKQADKAKEKEKRRESREPLSCGICSAGFYPNSPGSKYCSRECSRAAITASDRKRKSRKKAAGVTV